MAKLNPEAKDGDIDGLIQDGTEFERLESSHPSMGNLEPKTAIVTDDDTYPSLAAKNPVKGLTRHERAVQLLTLNGGKALIPGDLIKL